MSIALAVRNEEGVVIGADTLSNDADSDEHFIASKIQWLKGQRAACFVHTSAITSAAIVRLSA